MRLLQISDLHGDIAFIDSIGNELKAVDLVVLSGDLTNFAGRKTTVKIVDKLQRFNQNVLAVPGNCDHTAVGEYLADAGLSIDRTLKRFGDYTVCGIGGSLPCPGHTPNEYSEDEFARALSELSAEDDMRTIYVIHQPPEGTEVDRVTSGAHVGSTSIRIFLERATGFLCLTGHIHESAGIDTLNRVTVVNPGPACRGNYAVIEINAHSADVKLSRYRSACLP